MGFTYAWSNLFLEDYIRSNVSNYSSQFYHGLSSTAPAIDGTNVTEPASGYARAFAGAGNWPSASDRSITNTSSIIFDAATANWGTVGYALLYSVSTAGTLYGFGTLAASETVFNTDVVRFATGDYTVSFSGGIANTLANNILDSAFDNGVLLSEPATFYVGVSTTAPNSDGTNVTEPVGNNYARVSKTSNTTDWAAATSGSIGNAVDVTFGTATGSWGTITHWVMYDAATAGNLLFYGALDASQAVATSDQIKFLPGALTITIS